MRRTCRAPALVALLLLGCEGRKEVADAGVQVAAIEVKAAQVKVLPMPRYLTLTGSVVADQQSEVAANVAGRVTQTKVERGDHVEAGAVLAVVDAKTAGLNAAAARAQARAAESQANAARLDCARADLLLSKGAISRAEHERLAGQCGAQESQANAAQASARAAATLAGDTVIKAPISGMVGERFVNVGEYVQPPTRVASIYSVDPARVTISVPEPAVGLVRVGQELEIEVSSWPRRGFPATVRFVSPTLRPETRDRIIEAFAPNPEHLLLPGMFATVALRIGEEPLPAVPLASIKSQGNVRRLFLIRDGRAVERVVRTGVTFEGRIAIHDELADGEVVIVDPPPQLRDGTAVRVVNAPSARARR
jgi:membrane fusion protein, multidrug efflux system